MYVSKICIGVCICACAATLGVLCRCGAGERVSNTVEQWLKERRDGREARREG